MKTNVKKSAKSKFAASNPKPAGNSISAWEQDPGFGANPDGGQLIERPVPQLSKTSLPVKISNPSPAPKPGVYAPGTAEFRYWAAADALARGSEFWSAHLPGTSWFVGKTLPVNLDEGIDLNAFYDRVGLSFFHGDAGGRIVFSGESPDVVCHEQGHAILDAVKPQLWDVAYLEAAAFHEAAADVAAILVALQLQSLRHKVLAETGGSLYKVSRLSRMAEQLGWAIRQHHPTDVDPDCLRNAVNSFFYRDPKTLPTNAPANMLSSEAHSFSRVFTGAFFEALAGVFKEQKNNDEKGLQQASLDITKIFIAGVKAAPVVPAFFSSVALKMIQSAASSFSKTNYAQAFRSAFVRHGIISPATPVAAAGSHAAMGIAAAAPMAASVLNVVERDLDISEYGLGIDVIKVNTAKQSTAFAISGAALGIGSLPVASDDDEAKAFVEHLLRRGRLKVHQPKNKHAVAAMVVTRANEPETHDTHTHELKLEKGEYVLRRIRISCCFNH